MTLWNKVKNFCVNGLKIIAVGIILLLICFVSILLPPLGVYIMKNLFRADALGTFNFFSREVIARADPSNDGHVSVFHETGYGACFILSVILTICGWFPGAIFIFLLGGYNVMLSFRCVKPRIYEKIQ